MNRRAFLGSMVGGIAVRTWPFRVYSFPSEIRLARWYDDASNFDISKVPPIHLDLNIWIQIKTTSFINGFRGTFLDPEVEEALYDCERNEVGWSVEEAEEAFRSRF